MAENWQERFISPILLVTEHDAGTSRHRSGVNTAADGWTELDQLAAIAEPQIVVHATVLQKADDADRNQILLSWDRPVAAPGSRPGGVGVSCPPPVWLVAQAVHELIGTEVAVLVHPDDLRDFDQLWAEVIATTAMIRDLSIQLRHRSGNRQNATLRLANALDDRAVAGVVVAIVDVLPHHALSAAEPTPGPAVHDARAAAHAELGRLSHREREIVELLVRGERVPAIAAMLFVSKSTVRSQLSSVFHKLGVGSQQELIHLLR